MKLVIDTPELVRATEAVNLIPSRSGISPSEFIQLEKKGGNLYLYLASEVYGRMIAKSQQHEKGDWKFWTDRMSFVPFVTIAKELNSVRPFEVTLNESKAGRELVISNGRRKVVFNDMGEITGYSEYAGDQSVYELKLTPEQKRLLKLASKFATNDPTLAYINCVYLREKKAVYATNRTVIFSAVDTVLPTSVPFPISALQLFEADQINAVHIGKRCVKLDIDCGYIVQQLNKVAMKDFPISSIAKQLKDSRSYPTVFQIKAQSFISAMNRLNLYVSGVVNRDIVVKVLGKSGTSALKLACDSPQGSFSELVKLRNTLKQDVEIAWLLQSIVPLVDVAESISTIDVGYSEEKKSHYFISTKEGIQMILSRKA